MLFRYRRYNKTDPEKAKKFLLTDPDDVSEYESAQIFNSNVINVCLNSTYAFMRHLIQQVKALHEVTVLKHFLYLTWYVFITRFKMCFLLQFWSELFFWAPIKAADFQFASFSFFPCRLDYLPAEISQTHIMSITQDMDNLNTCYFSDTTSYINALYAILSVRISYL